MNGKEGLVGQRLEELEQLLEEAPDDGRTAAEVLDVADTLSRVLGDREDGDYAGMGDSTPLPEAVSALYRVATEVFDAPEAAGSWQRLRQQYRHTSDLFDREVRRLRRECEMAR